MPGPRPIWPIASRRESEVKTLDEEGVAELGERPEWLVANRRGSFAFGCRDRVPRRKYHGLLVVRDAGFDQPLHVCAAMLERLIDPDGGQHDLGGLIQQGKLAPAGALAPDEFEAAPHPRWRYRLRPGVILERELRLTAFEDAAVLRYTISGPLEGWRLFLRPLLSCRPIHRPAIANPALDGRGEIAPGRIRWRPYPQLPTVELTSQPAGRWLEAGRWVHAEYPEEAARGYEAREDLYNPGQLLIDLGAAAAGGSAAAVEVRLGAPTTAGELDPPPARCADSLAGRLAAGAGAFVVRRRGGGTSVVAGYPWFDEWSRDALIALPGLLLATGDLETAERVLSTYADHRVDQLVPNILPRGAAPADVHAIDASLWFCHAVAAFGAAGGEAARFRNAVLTTVARLERPTAIGTQLGPEQELRVGAGPRALTWMDAITADGPVTPRAGEPIEVAALWIGASRLAASLAADSGQPERAEELTLRAERLAARLVERFWLEPHGYLADRLDPDGKPVAELRPNQLIAAGAPWLPLSGDQRRRLLAAVDGALLTPFGLRTLAPSDPAYRGRCAGSQRERDLAYHNGTVWPWLLGPYADAVRQALPEAAARERLAPLLEPFAGELAAGCLGQLAEIHDGDAPHQRRGAPAQAWSLSEVLRIASWLEEETRCAS